MGAVQLHRAMQSVLAKPAVGNFRSTVSLRSLAEHGFATIIGSKIVVSENDRRKIEEYLDALGLPRDRPILTDKSRAEALRYTPFEKTAGRRVKAGRICIKAARGNCLDFGSGPLVLPPRAHIDVVWDVVQASLARHSSVVVVENFEPFERLHESEIEGLELGENPLVAYRGDGASGSQAALAECIRAVDLPVFAYVDADPAGMSIARSLPNLKGLLLPRWEDFERQLRTPGMARPDLFEKQYRQMQSMMRADIPLGLRRVVDAIWTARSCLVQERWIGSRLCVQRISFS